MKVAFQFMQPLLTRRPRGNIQEGVGGEKSFARFVKVSFNKSDFGRV